jgi:apolipoprotein N-acyltransferase
LGRLNEQKGAFLAIISGGLLTLSFPKFNLELLAWVALVPLFFAIKDENFKESFRLGVISGFIYFGGLLYWIAPTIVEYGNLSPIAGYSVFILLISYLSLYVGGFTCLLAFLEANTGLSFIVTAPFLWVLLEYLRSLLFSGFPWESLGYSQFLCLSIIQVADITGIYGVSFLIILINSTIFNILSCREKRKANCLIKEVLVALMLLLAAIGYGYWKLQGRRPPLNGSRTIKVGLIQGNIDQKRKWDPFFQKETMDIYRKLTLEAAKERLNLIVWPETAAPFYFYSHEKYRSVIFDISRKTEAYLLFGSPAQDFRRGKARYFNSAYLIGPGEEILGRYDKVHLVPFGEYVPLKNLFTFLGKIVEGVGDFSPGDSIEPLKTSFGKFGALICFEGIFPDISRRFVNRGADFLVNITNDAWFGKSSAPYQHLSMAAFRAVENRVFVVRSANTGISALINTKGKIVSKTGIFSREILTGRIELTKKRRTFYTIYGDIFAYFCIMVSLILILVSKYQGGQK